MIAPGLGGAAAGGGVMLPNVGDPMIVVLAFLLGGFVGGAIARLGRRPRDQIRRRTEDAAFLRHRGRDRRLRAHRSPARPMILGMLSRGWLIPLLATSVVWVPATVLGFALDWSNGVIGSLQLIGISIGCAVRVFTAEEPPPEEA